MSDPKSLVVDARVVRAFVKFNPAYDILRGGVITADAQPDRISKKMKVVVKWDGTYVSINEIAIEDLMLESEAKALVSKLEVQWQGIQERAKAKLEEAAKSIEDAVKIAKEGDIDLFDMYEATRPLLHAMDEAGWQTSSLSC
jgi:hypothetical protein